MGLSRFETSGLVVLIRKYRKACRHKRSRLWLRIVLATLGDKWAIKALANDACHSDFVQTQAIHHCLKRMQSRRGNRALTYIAEHNGTKWIRVVAGLFVVYHHCKSGIAILSEEARRDDGDPVSRCEAFFGLAWAGSQSGVDGIRELLVSQPAQKTLIQLWKMIMKYGSVSIHNREFFLSVQVMIEQTIDPKKLAQLRLLFVAASPR